MAIIWSLLSDLVTVLQMKGERSLVMFKNKIKKDTNRRLGHLQNSGTVKKGHLDQVSVCHSLKIKTVFFTPGSLILSIRSLLDTFFAFCFYF